MTAALQQKYLAALGALPGIHSEFWIDPFLHKPVSGNPGQFDLFAIGTGFLSLTHPFPLETALTEAMSG
jgi:hypothetical protein